ncbi:hypothetical protein N7526_011447 [Penicillium atrosanguineum]|nr:hypothetical protein N7526_011447 [Penicillium atrosanguineum]
MQANAIWLFASSNVTVEYIGAFVDLRAGGALCGLSSSIFGQGSALGTGKVPCNKELACAVTM